LLEAHNSQGVKVSGRLCISGASALSVQPTYSCANPKGPGQTRSDTISRMRPSSLNHALALAAGGTFILELALLAFVERVFTGGWLGDYVLSNPGERLGLTAVLALYALAGPGLLLAIGIPALRLVRIRGDRAAWIISLTWLLLVALFVCLEMRIASFVKNALDLDLVRRLGGGTVFGAVEYVLTWFWLEMLLGLLALVAAIWLCRVLYLHLRTKDFSGSRLGRVPRVWARVAVTLALIFVAANATVLGRSWPTVTWAVSRSFVGTCFHEAIARASDLDGDGVGAFDLPPDQEPFDATRHPFSADTPDDGVDGNGLLGDLKTADIPPALRAATDRRRSYAPIRLASNRNVVLAFLESFRWDLVGAVENERPVTPVLSKLIADGEALHVEGAWACIGYTAPSIRQSFWGGHVRRGTTLVHDLRDDNGYYCGTASGQDESWDTLDTDTALDSCDFYEDPRQDDQQYVSGGIRAIDRVLLSIDRFLDARERDRPFFLYLNLQDCHFPYGNAAENILYDDLPNSPSLGRANAHVLRRLHANQAANVDRGIGALRDRLVREGSWKNTILVLISDHGESIYHDDVLGHGLRLTDHQTKVACIIVHPTVDVVEPLAHVDLRGLIRGMLSAPEPARAPVVRKDPESRLLQVIGSVRRPRRIAHVDAEGRRVIYDLERGLCIDQTSGTTCPLTSSNEEHANLVSRVHDLIRHWEYERWMMDTDDTER
jgi:sulfatase-like protein